MDATTQTKINDIYKALNMAYDLVLEAQETCEDVRMDNIIEGYSHNLDILWRCCENVMENICIGCQLIEDEVDL